MASNPTEGVYSWAELTGEQALALRSLNPGEFLSIRYDVIQMFDGDITAAVLFSELLAWSSLNKVQDNDGWFYHTSGQIAKRLKIKRSLQNRVRNTLTDMGLLETERRDVPAKNYYRINLTKTLELLTACWQENVQPDVRKTDNKENKPVNVVEVEKSISYSSSDTRKSANKSTHVLSPDRHQKAVEWIVTNYPRNNLGLGATEAQATSIVNRLGKLAPGETEDVALGRLNQFKKGVSNFRDAVESGTYDRSFVFGFAKFAGLGVQYGDAPKYLAWADMKPAKKKPTLEGVI
jgi:hypothetical protein